MPVFKKASSPGGLPSAWLGGEHPLTMILLPQTPKASAVPSPTGVLLDGGECEEGRATGVGVLAGPAWQQLSWYGMLVLPHHLCGPEQPTRSHGEVPSSIVSFSS